MKTALIGSLLGLVSCLLIQTGEASTPVNNFSVDTQSRDAVLSLWNNVYRPMMNVPTGWQGNISTGNAGTTSTDFQNAALSRLNWYRAMAGVSTQIDLNTDWCRKCQEASLVMAVLPVDVWLAQAHHLDPSWKWYTSDAAWAALVSNISYGDSSLTAMDGFIEDAGDDNMPVGHRGKALVESMDMLGVGIVSDILCATAVSGTAYASGTMTAPQPRDGFTAWPPKGYVPYGAVYDRWSFEIPATVMVANNYASVSASNAIVTVTCNGKAVPCRIEYNGRALGSRLTADRLVFKLWEANATHNTSEAPLESLLLSGGLTDELRFVGRADGLLGISPTSSFQDITYHVTVSGLMANHWLPPDQYGQQAPSTDFAAVPPISYDVTVFDPDAANAAPVFLSSSGTISSLSGGSTTISVQVKGITNGTNPTIEWFQGSVGDDSVPVSGTSFVSFPTGYTQAGGYELASPTTSIAVPATSGTSLYWARATNAAGATNSPQIVLTTIDPVIITQQPSGKLFGPSEASLSLSVAATGTPPLAYQWYRGASGDERTPIVGATAATITLATKKGDYWVKVSNAGSHAYSSTAKFLPLPAPKDSTPSSTVLISPNTEATLTDYATGSYLSYQWYIYSSTLLKYLPISGAVSASYITDPLLAPAAFYCRVSNSAGGISSKPITVTPDFYFLFQPSNFIPCTANSVNLKVSVGVVVAKGAPQVSYQWYRGLAGDTSSPVANATAASLAIPAQEASYWCRVANGVASLDSSVAQVVFASKPVITTQPASSVIAPNGTQSLSVAATGIDLAYQWFAYSNTSRKFLPLDGATGATFTTAAISIPSQFYCQVSNEAGIANSKPATVAPAFFIRTQPKAFLPCSPSSRNLKASVSVVVAKGAPKVSYQWYRGLAGDTSSPVANATAASLAVPAQEASYWCRVSNGSASLDSSVAQVVFASKPVITTQPASSVIAPNGTQSLSVAATGNDLNYQWFAYSNFARKFLPLDGATGATFTTAAISIPSQFYCQVSNEAGSVNSKPATVSPAFYIQTQPAAAVSCTPASTRLAVSIGVKVARGSSPVTYQWYQGLAGDNSLPVASGTAASLSIPAQEASYWCRVSNGSASIDSTASKVGFLF